MSQRILAYCGLECTECPAFLATGTDDDTLRAKTAKRWSSKEWTVAPAEVNCLGCTAETGHFKWCARCEVRGCAVEKGVATCAGCADYGCDTLEALLKMVGDEARRKLEALRAQS